MWFTIAWILVVLSAATIEGVALFNSETGDTLSEHLWAWLGIRGKSYYMIGLVYTEKINNMVTPKWTLRISRTVFISAMVWFILHITTGGWI